ncbi:histone deacetylase family protein [Aidingimonas halophila]|uniref:Acetoin utilization deacetylase AcuC n=1 Tax=Aidingimonas halophila TaxID=574349 RepID=A0A1H3BJS2_9GAMM|nr:histone deacetylase family protein [Aidingimonas halophila]GHC26640.1 deacetylase [Aidingimonas halophila]SDX42011.1 Acetoin utilization deacetylase AcuC [Aidingimonas halophila]
MITAYVTHRDYHLHHMGPGHPECPARLEAIQKRLALAGVLQQTMQFDAKAATDEQLASVHSPSYLNYLAQRQPTREWAVLDGDTRLNSHSLAAGRLAAGAVVSGVDKVYRGQADNVFCAVRPPGHHAETAAAMGFCFYNNVAVGATYAKQRYGAQRIAIADFDVHQCNGTIDIFKNDPDVLICTSFQRSFYPWRYLDEEYPNVINTPLPAGAGSDAFRRAVEQQWLPALHDFRPELVLISAGFDAHRNDPMAGLCLDNADFYWVTRQLIDVASQYADNRLVSTLEGGYDLVTLGYCVEAHLKALLGQPWAP